MFSVELEEQRCENCNRLLFKGILGLGFIEAKCTRCGNINLLHSFDSILLGKSDTYILVYDTLGKVIIASKNAMKILGYDTEELIGLPIKTLCENVKNLPPLPSKVDRDALAKWDTYHAQLPDKVTHHTKAGEGIQVAARFYPLLSANGIYSMGVFKIISDKV